MNLSPVLKKEYVYLLILGVVLPCFYSTALNNFFTADDTLWLKQALFVHQGKWELAAHSFPGGYPRPLTTAYFSIAFSVFKLNPQGYYFLNLFFHAINALLVYAMLRMMGRVVSMRGHTEIAFFSAALFFIHPSNNEVIFFASDIHDILCVFWGMTALLLYLQFSLSGKKAFFFLSLLCFLFSMLTKESGIVFFALLCLLTLIFLNNESPKKSIVRLLPFALLSLAYFFPYSQNSLHRSGYYIGWHVVSIMAKYFFSFVASLFFITKSFLFTLSTFKTLDPQTFYMSMAMKYLQPVIIVTGGFLLLMTAFPRPQAFSKENFTSMSGVAKFFILGALWAALGLLPVTLMKELETGSPFTVGRYMYFPSAGFCVAAGCIFSAWASRLNAHKHRLGFMLFCVFLSALFAKNLFSFTITEKTFEMKGNLNRYVLTTIGSQCAQAPPDENMDVYLINAPRIIQHLLTTGVPEGVFLFYEKQATLHWVDGITKTEAAETQNSKCFLEFHGNELRKALTESGQSG